MPSVTFHTHYRRADGSASPASHSSACKSVAEAKKWSLDWATGGDNHHSRFYFHVVGENIDVWFTVKFVWEIGRRKPVAKVVEVYAPEIGYDAKEKDHAIAQAKKTLGEWTAWQAKVEETNQQWKKILDCERRSQESGYEELAKIREQPVVSSCRSSCGFGPGGGALALTDDVGRLRRRAYA
jgi:hypothetical protein